MGHLASRDAYKNLEDRINWFTQGAPVSDSLYKILQVLYTEKEAKWVALLPVRPFTAKKAAHIWNTSEAKAEKFLTHLCEKALLVDSYHNGVRKFVMPPPMAGFIEFALMRTRGDIDQKYLSELYYQYMNVEEDFVKDLFFVTETRLGRVFVQEPVLTNEYLVLGIRPEFIDITADGEISGEIYGAMPTGMESTIKVRIGDFLLTGVVFGSTLFTIGSRVHIDISGETVMLFDRKSGKCVAFGALEC